jgi:hypothetical protein
MIFTSKVDYYVSLHIFIEKIFFRLLAQPQSLCFVFFALFPGKLSEGITSHSRVMSLINRASGSSGNDGG